MVSGAVAQAGSQLDDPSAVHERNSPRRLAGDRQKLRLGRDRSGAAARSIHHCFTGSVRGSTTFGLAVDANQIWGIDEAITYLRRMGRRFLRHT